MLKNCMGKVDNMLEQTGYFGSKMETTSGNARGKMKTQEQECGMLLNVAHRPDFVDLTQWRKKLVNLKNGQRKFPKLKHKEKE